MWYIIIISSILALILLYFCYLIAPKCKHCNSINLKLDHYDDRFGETWYTCKKCKNSFMVNNTD